MTAYAYEIPGYVQGFRFSDDAKYYDSTLKRFKDLAGYGETNELQIDVGTPSFVTVGGERGLTLDNTVQGSFLPSIPWHGSIILVAKASFPSTAATLNLLIFGASATVSGNGRLYVSRSSGNRNIVCTTASAVNTQTLTESADQMRLACFSKSQETRIGYSSDDGITVNATAAVASALHGNGLAMAYRSGATADEDHIVRFGNLSGTAGDYVATPDTLTIFEMHFFKGVILTENLASTKNFIDSLIAKYAIP